MSKNTGYDKIRINEDILRLVRRDKTTVSFSVLSTAPAKALKTLLTSREKEWGILKPISIDTSSLLAYLIDKNIEYKGSSASVITVMDSRSATELYKEGYALFSATPVVDRDNNTTVHYTLIREG